MLWRKKKPLLQCEVIHQLPGRVRIGCRALRYLTVEADEIRQRLEDLMAVACVRVSVPTENVLVQYDPGQATADDMLQQTESVLGSYSLIAYKADRAAQSSWTVGERRLQEEPISQMLVRIAMTAATFAPCSAQTACSRLEPQPKSSPATMTSPGLVLLINSVSRSSIQCFASSAVLSVLRYLAGMISSVLMWSLL